MAHTIPTIRVYPGTDETVRQQGMLSGFEDMPPTQLEGLIDMVTAEARSILKKAPQELVDATIPEPFDLPLYLKHLPEGAEAALRTTGSHRIYTGMDVSDFRPAGYSLPHYKGIIIARGTDNQPEKMRVKVGHEIIHILTRFGIQGHMMAPMEALVARTEKICYPEAWAKEGLLQSEQWNPSTFMSSTGFCPPDFAGIRYGRSAMESTYIHAYRDADVLREEQVWNIWTLLNTQAARCGMTPTLGAMHTAILSQAQDQGAQMLTRPSFRPMIAGNHIGAFGKRNRELRVYTFTVNERADFNTIIAAGEAVGQQEILFDAPDAPQRFAIHVQDAKGFLIPGIELKGTVAVSMADFPIPAMLQQACQNRGINQALHERGISGIAIQATGFPTVSMHF